MSLRAVTVVHPYGVAHKAHATARRFVHGKGFGWAIEWDPPFPPHQPRVQWTIADGDEGIEWLWGHDHPEDVTKALVAAASLARSADA